eukprot:IDg3903t1
MSSFFTPQTAMQRAFQPSLLRLSTIVRASHRCNVTTIARRFSSLQSAPPSSVLAHGAAERANSQHSSTTLIAASPSEPFDSASAPPHSDGVEYGDAAAASAAGDAPTADVVALAAGAPVLSGIGAYA